MLCQNGLSLAPLKRYSRVKSFASIQLYGCFCLQVDQMAFELHLGRIHSQKK